MLVLTRKANQSIVLSGGIRVTILGIKGGQVRIGVSAPPDVTIDREEVYRRIREWAGPDSLDHSRPADGIAV